MSDKDDIIEIPYDPGMAYGGYPVPSMPVQNKADLIDKIKPEAMVEIIRHRLMGEEFLNEKWIPVKALSDRKLSDEGAWEIANLMLGVSSINISISSLNDREIKERLKRIAKSAQYLLISNWKRYGVKNTAQFYYVHEIIFSNTLAVLKQADKASIQELLKGTVQEHRNYGYVQREGRGKKIGRMLGLND